jgi:hypothetical protein
MNRHDLSGFAFHPERPALKDAAKGSRSAHRISGTQRADLYVVLVGSGLRINEARMIRVYDLSLDAAIPGINLRPEVAKNGKAGFQPLAPDVVEGLRSAIAGRKASAPVFDIPADLTRRSFCRRMTEATGLITGWSALYLPDAFGESRLIRSDPRVLSRPAAISPELARQSHRDRGLVPSEHGVPPQTAQAAAYPPHLRLAATSPAKP